MYECLSALCNRMSHRGCISYVTTLKSVEHLQSLCSACLKILVLYQADSSFLTSSFKECILPSCSSDRPALWLQGGKLSPVAAIMIVLLRLLHFCKQTFRFQPKEQSDHDVIPLTCLMLQITCLISGERAECRALALKLLTFLYK